jgi:hypothetical protein
MVTHVTPRVKSILDPAFRYVPSHETDIRKTFERIRREREKAALAKVVPASRDKKST